MKKSLFLFLLILTFGSQLKAQKIGITGGFVNSGAPFDSQNALIPDLDRLNSFYVGAYFDFRLSAKLRLSPELLFSQRGTRTQIGSGAIRAVNNTLSLPVLLNYDVTDKLSLNAGVEYAYWLDYQFKGETDFEIDLNRPFRDLGSLLFGASFKVNENLSANVRYGWTIWPVGRGQIVPQLNGSLTTITIDGDPNYLQLGLSYQLFDLNGLSQRRRQRNDVK